jgi:hypothetical protein
MENLTKEQELAIKCAYLDLKGALENYQQHSYSDPDWEAYEQSIEDLENAFPLLKFI